MSLKPIVYLLCGLPGSGKSTYARKLEEAGAIRYTLDEELFKRFGRHFESGYVEKEAETKTQLRDLCEESIKAGKSAILDFGFWKKTERDAYKQFVEGVGGEWKLLYFAVPEQELKRRLQVRNDADQDRNHHISEELLDKFMSEFETPSGEREEVIR